MSSAAGPQRPTGVVGLGNVGTGVVRALAAAGREIVAFDSDARRLAELGTLAVPAASNAALAHAAGVVLVVVFDDAQVRHVFTAPDGILAAADPPDVVAILSTVSADTMRWASAQAAPRRFEVIDCGLAVGRGFEQGGVVATVGGSEEAYALAAPTLAAFAAPLLHVGPLGSGMQAKLMLNMLQYDLALIGFETGALLRAAGIDAGVFAEAFRARQAVGPDVTDYLRVAASAAADPRISLETFARHGVKDLAIALALGAALRVDLPATQANLRAFREIAAGADRDGA